MTEAAAAATAAQLAALVGCFDSVPTAAIPSVVDCVLSAGGAPPSSLFSALLRAFSVSSERNALPSNAIAHATALCYLVERAESPADAMKMIIWDVFVPMLRGINSKEPEILTQIIILLYDTTAKYKYWKLLGRTFVVFCMWSVSDGFGLLHENDVLAVYCWRVEGGVDEDSRSSHVEPLQPLIATHILALLLDYMLSKMKAIENSEEMKTAKFSSSSALVHYMIWDLSKLALNVFSNNREHRLCATQILFPSLFASLSLVYSVTVYINGTEQLLSRSGLLKQIWELCMSLSSIGQMQNLEIFMILSIYYSVDNLESGSVDLLTGDKTEELCSKRDKTEEFDLCTREEFWSELRKLLVSKDSFSRKQALYVLKRLLGNCFPLSQGNFHKHYSGTDVSSSENAMSHRNAIDDTEKSNGLVTKREKFAEKEAKSLGVADASLSIEHVSSIQDRWKVFLLLYEMLEEYGTHLVEAAWTVQVEMFLKSALESISNGECNPHESQMATPEGILNWMAILWERGFNHDNPQVRSLIMESFLEQNENHAHMIPASFVLGPLIHGLNDVVHHTDFGVGGVYSSKTIVGAERFFNIFSHRLRKSARISLVFHLASAAREVSFGRAGLMTLACCISSAANQARGCQNISCPHDELDGSIQEATSFITTADLLESLGILAERSKQHFNASYRLKVCEQALLAACSLLSPAEISLDLLLLFISAVPREFTDLSGPLRGMAQKWLTESSDESVGAAQTLNQLLIFPYSLVDQVNQTVSFDVFDDEDIGCWEAEAGKWARVLLLCLKEQQFDTVSKFLQNYVGIFSEQRTNTKSFSVKFLIIICSLVEELRIYMRKFTLSTRNGCNVLTYSKEELGQSPYVCIHESFTKSLLSILIHIMAFGESACSIFWSSYVEKFTDLPSSVRGKLGGPSQRRLSSSLVPSVLVAIWSLRCISNISSWCCSLEVDSSLNSVFHFLWEHCWRIVQHPPSDSEAGAELQLAAYESLAHVLGALSSSYNSSSVHSVPVLEELSKLNGSIQPSLDLFVTTFLGSINNSLSHGMLARSRRAVLIYWKWNCVDSLLSIPEKIHDTEHAISKPMYSKSTLQAVFLDIVESLENVGEKTVVYILRCARLVLGLLCSDNCWNGSALTSEMIWQLVKSSWILHLSCNKRRVAPIAALLSSVLHPAVFCNLSMHEADGKKDGPIKWFVQNLLDEGIKSPRTIRLAALHLSGLWLMYPQTIRYYVKELKLLSLYGSVAFDEDFESELSENLEAKLEVSSLARCPHQEFAEEFLNTELFARVTVAVLFYNLQNMAKNVGVLPSEDLLAAVRSAKIFLLELLDSAVNDRDLSKELYKKYSGIHRRKVRAWQMICILSPFVEKDIVEDATSKLHLCLYRNNLPAVRQYLEIFAIQIYLTFPTLAKEQLIPIFHNRDMRPQALSSYVFIAANLILHSRNSALQEKHLNELLPPILPFLTSHHHNLRGFSQLLIHGVFSKLWQKIQHKSSECLESKCFEDLKVFLSENRDVVRLRASMESFLYDFDPDAVVTPSGIFNARLEAAGFECVPVSLMERVVDFLNDARDDLRRCVEKETTAIKNESLAVLEDKDCNLMAGNPSLIDGLSPSSDLVLDFQKKITPQKGCPQPVRFSTVDELEKEDLLFDAVLQSRSKAVEKVMQSQCQLILVASLVDRIPNLAGLARSCEVFKASALVIADKSILRDKQFQLISVTAEKWLPIIEVPVGSIKPFLERQKHAGFSIIGLEQTANSISLDKYSFPDKTVLVLGREKEGIPADIIHILDSCVEIPQQGIIRSLNVHVSGAIALWEYSRQKRAQ